MTPAGDRPGRFCLWSTQTGRAWQNAVVIGSGPNGFTAAIELAKAGLRTTVFEAEATVGGGTRSAELTLPGFVHDVCSAVHPLALSSPVFNCLPLAEHGLEWIRPTIPLAHPLDDGSAAVLDQLPTMAFFVERWPDLVEEILQPLLHVPASPMLMARFGSLALWPATTTAQWFFRTDAARALFAGLAAHSVLPLEASGSSAFGWVLAIAARAVGWPIPRGGSQMIANSLASYFESLGGRIVTSTRIRSLEEIDESTLILCDVSPRQFVGLAGTRLPEHFRRKLTGYRYGPGVFKIDWALSGPIPWKASECSQAGTVHVGGTLHEIASSERAAWKGWVAERPFVLLAQPSLFDPSRAPEGKHTAWAYCHVPNGCDVDMRDAIERQVERFAPGFRSCILARHTFSPAEMEGHNANLVGGDISGGANNLKQLVFRPTRWLYRTPLDSVYLCSSSTPPGGGVHGMCGFHAAQMALRDAGIYSSRTQRNIDG